MLIFMCVRRSGLCTPYKIPEQCNPAGRFSVVVSRGTSRKDVNVTDDDQIIAKLEARDESALADIMGLYGSKCRRTAQRILGSEADAQEVMNDALLSLWNAIPPAKPNDLGAYLSTTVRNIALHRLEKEQAQKRTGEREAYSLDEENAPQPADPQNIDRLVDEGLLRTAVNRFLATLSEDACTIFVARYGSGKTVAEIAKDFRITQSKVTVTLMRTRRKLRKYLNEEGWL